MTTTVKTCELMFKQIDIVNGKPVEVELTSPDPLSDEERAFWSAPHAQTRLLSDGRVKDERTGLISEPCRDLSKDPETPIQYTPIPSWDEQPW